jgi:formylglycine-generating enzyme
MQDIPMARRFAMLSSVVVLGSACGGSKLRVTTDAASDSAMPDLPWPDGGAVGTGGAVGSGGAVGTGGIVGTGGVVGTGGTTGTGGTGTGGTGGGPAACPVCQTLESCWADASGTRCIESAVPIPSAFAIDDTEVTRGQYGAWLATRPGVGGQLDVCAWNTTFEPDPACMLLPQVCQGSDCALHPQVCIDMCDAAAYCVGIGRNLCTEGDWRIACSSNGQYPAVYGPNYTTGVCNDYTVHLDTTLPVASLTGCQAPASSGYAGVFDMIGNAEEWVQNCTPAAGASDSCKPLGLSFGQGAAAPTCSQATYANRSATKPTLGFRCCAR